MLPRPLPEWWQKGRKVVAMRRTILLSGAASFVMAFAGTIAAGRSMAAPVIGG